MSRNQYGGTCYRCGKKCEAGDGHFEKVSLAHVRRDPSLRGQKWRLQHATCAIEYRGTNQHYQRKGKD